MLLGMPPSWLGSNVVVPTYALSFLLIQYTFVYDLIQTYVPPSVLEPLLILADGSLRALSIAKLGVDGSRMRFAADAGKGGAVQSEPWFAMLLLGMIAGSGGGMWADLLKLKSHQWTLTATPNWAKEATWDMKAALLSAFFYAASTSPQFYGLLSRGNDGSYVASSNTGGLLELQDAKAMTMMVMCTLLLGKQADQATGVFSSLANSISTKAFSSFAGKAKSSSSSLAAVAKKKKQDDESVGLNRIDKEDEVSSYQSLPKRRGIARKIDYDLDLEDDEEEQEVKVEEVKKSSGGRKKSSSTKKREESPPPTIPTPVRSTRQRRAPSRPDL